MIEIRLVFERKEGLEFLAEVESKGHSSVEKKELCSALSLLEYTFYYSLKSMTQIQFSHEIRDGFFKIVVSSVDKKDDLVYNHLCGFYLVGLKTLEASNKDDLLLKEVR